MIFDDTLGRALRWIVPCLALTMAACQPEPAPGEGGDAAASLDGSVDGAQPDPEPGEPEPAPDPEAEPSTDAAPEPEPAPDPEPGEPEPTPDPEPGEPEPTPDPEPGEPEPGEPEPTPDPEPGEPEPTPDPEPGEPEPTPDPEPEPEREPFSFFVTSLEAMQRLSGSPDGFGGNFGGILGADRICQAIAQDIGQDHKEWKAFLSATAGPDGSPVHAIQRIGEGPWYDANGRLVAENIAGLLSGDRPAGDPQTVSDLPDEYGVPLSALGDSHDVVTATNRQGMLASNDPRDTCYDWTRADANVGPRNLMCGHSFPRGGGGGRPARDGANWMSDHTLRGCVPGVNLIQNGPGVGNCIGCSGGYGALYCFALAP